GSGLLNVFLPHATAGIALMETGSGSEQDLDEVIDRLLPRDDRYAHAHGSTGHGGDHLLPVFVPPSLTLPVDDGEVVLGTWQSVVIVDPNRENNRRRIRLSFLEGMLQILAGAVPLRVLAVGRLLRGHGLHVAFSEQEVLPALDLHLEAGVGEEQH